MRGNQEKMIFVAHNVFSWIFCDRNTNRPKQQPLATANNSNDYHRHLLNGHGLFQSKVITVNNLLYISKMARRGDSQKFYRNEMINI